MTGNFYFNLRRAIKARAMLWGVPVQIVQPATVGGKRAAGRQLQEKATRAWNFCTALYYKAEGVPWRPLAFEQEACFVGIDFYVAHQGKGRLGEQTVRPVLVRPAPARGGVSGTGVMPPDDPSRADLGETYH